MIDIDVFVNLADQYAKHKWILRRVLLSEGPGELWDHLAKKFPDAEVLRRDVDALWFSRKNRDSETWELRRIGSPPFALVEVMDDGLSVNERERKLASLELEMANSGRPASEH